MPFRISIFFYILTIPDGFIDDHICNNRMDSDRINCIIIRTPWEYVKISETKHEIESKEK